MAYHPLKIVDKNVRIENTRKTLLEEENGKIIGTKGFVFTKFKTEKERLRELMKEKELIKQYQPQDTSMSRSNSSFIKTNNSLDNHINPEGRSKSKIIQPSMRFKARTDLERIVDTVNLYSYGRANMDIINKQLKNLELNVSKKNLDESDDEILDYASSSVKRLQRQMLTERQKDKTRNNFLDSDISSKRNTKKKIDNSEARHLMSDLHYKTHFKGATGYMIFGDKSTAEQEFFKSRMLKSKMKEKTANRTLKPSNSAVKGNDRNNTTSPNQTSNDNNFKAVKHSSVNGEYMKTNHNFNKKNNNFANTFSDMLNRQATNTQMSIFTNSNAILTDPEVNRELMTSNPLLYNLSTNPFKKKSDWDENVDMKKLQYIKSLAFANKEDETKERKFNFKSAGFIKKLGNSMRRKMQNATKKSDELFKNNPVSFFTRFGENNDEYNNKKVEEDKIIIDGEEFLKTDIEHISRKVLTGCNFLQKKNKNNNQSIKSGNGKLMITSGLTVGDFMKKYNLKK